MIMKNITKRQHISKHIIKKEYRLLEIWNDYEHWFKRIIKKDHNVLPL